MSPKTGRCSSISARSRCACTTSAAGFSPRTTPAPTGRRASPTVVSRAKRSNARCTRGSFISRQARRSALPAPRTFAPTPRKSKTVRSCSRNSEAVERLSLTLAIGDYEHTRDLATGQVPVQGASLNVLNLSPEEAFFRFTFFREWEVSEMSMGKYVSLRSQEDNSIAAIPVFPSRAFRQSMIYVREGGKIERPEQLKGKRIGVPEWAQTAVIYSRGYLTHQAQVPLASVEWIQAGVNEAGRVEKVKPKLPEGVRLRPEPRHSLNDMLLAGDIDALLSARPPRGIGSGIRRLFPDYEAGEAAYFRETGIFPIMHVIVIKTEVLERHPWLAMNLYKAFEEAKRRSVERLSDITASHAPLAWLAPYAERMKSLFGEDFWPYGLEKNRTTLQAFIDFAFEQGVCHRRLELEELFPRQVLTSFKV